MRKTKWLLALMLTFMLMPQMKAQEDFIGEIRLFGGNFDPLYWMSCEGQLLQISQYTALFSILGTTYGGDGQSTFALPDMRGRVVVGTDANSSGLGEKGGLESVTLFTPQITAHTHTASATAPCSSTAGTVNSPVGAYPAVIGLKSLEYSTTTNSTMGAGNVVLTPQAGGGNQPHENRQPYLGLRYMICVEGIYPSRN